MMRLRSPSFFARRAGRVMAAAGLAAGLIGCAEDFDSKAQLESLRVLAVRADNPYPKPGETVRLDMLWYDGKSPPDQARPVEVFWISGCFNPLGDLYYQCFQQLGEKFAAGAEDPASLEQWVGFGNSFDFDLPEDLISSRPPQPGRTPYGLTFVFFAACAGRVAPVEPGEDGLPLGCLDDQGNRLGPDDFVPGYFALYSYEEVSNSNPKVDALLVDGKPVGENEEPVFPRCVEGNCKELEIKVQVDPTSVEQNPLSLDADGNPQTEMMWVDYFASNGRLDKPSRLVNDAQKGFNDQNEVKLKLPADIQKVYLFAVVHDSRGGVQWIQRAIRTE